METKLRKLQESDLKTFFNFQQNEEANFMAAFISRDPKNWDEFINHWNKILSDDLNYIRTITYKNIVVGNMLSFLMFEQREIGYWIDKDYWGKGIATEALKLFLFEIKERPLFAHVAFDNIGSIKVLEKCGFTKIGEDKYFAKAREKEITEFIL